MRHARWNQSNSRQAGGINPTAGQGRAGQGKTNGNALKVVQDVCLAPGSVEGGKIGGRADGARQLVALRF